MHFVTTCWVMVHPVPVVGVISQSSGAPSYATCIATRKTKVKKKKKKKRKLKHKRLQQAIASHIPLLKYDRLCLRSEGPAQPLLFRLLPSCLVSQPTRIVQLFRHTALEDAKAKISFPHGTTEILWEFYIYPSNTIDVDFLVSGHSYAMLHVRRSSRLIAHSPWTVHIKTEWMPLFDRLGLGFLLILHREKMFSVNISVLYWIRNKWKRLSAWTLFHYYLFAHTRIAQN